MKNIAYALALGFMLAQASPSISAFAGEGKSCGCAHKKGAAKGDKKSCSCKDCNCESCGENSCGHDEKKS